MAGWKVLRSRGAEEESEILKGQNLHNRPGRPDKYPSRRGGEEQVQVQSPKLPAAWAGSAH